jgi:hypothetical protein
MSFVGVTKTLGLLLHLITLSETHTLTHIRYDSSGREICPLQRPLPANTQHSQETDTHPPRGVRTRNSSKLMAADLLNRQRGHWDSFY